MINADGDIVLIIRSGSKTRNQSIIKVASVSRKEVIRFRSNKVPKWIVKEALSVLSMDHDPDDVYFALAGLKVGDNALLKRRDNE